MNRTSRHPRPARGAVLLLVVSLPAILPGAPLAPPLGAQEDVRQEAVTLRLDGRRGDLATYRYDQQIDLRMPPEFGGDQAVASHLVVRQQVERVDETSIRYLVQVREVNVEMGSSPATDDLDFSRFEGQHFRMTVDRRGELQEMVPLGEAGPGVEQLRQSMRQVGFPLLPRGPVRSGETWVDTTRIDAAAMALPAEGEIVSVSRTTLNRLVREGDATVAELDVETEFRFEPGAGAMPGMQVEVAGERADEVRFDVTRGRFLASSGTQEFEMKMAIPGAASSLSIQGTATSRAELLPGS